MRTIIVGGLTGTMDLAAVITDASSALYLGATVDLCRQMRTELVRRNYPRVDFVTFDDLARRPGHNYRLISPLEQEVLLRKLSAGRWPQIQSMAEFSGFWRELARAASELVQSGAREDNLLAAAGSFSGLAREVCELLATYWQYLRKHELYDRSLSLSFAVSALSERAWEQVVVDGFTDFTPLQEECLQLLCQKADRVLLNLPGATLSEAAALAQRLDGEFQLKQRPETGLAAQQVQALAVSSLRQEVEEACRWLKMQIKDGCAPSQLVLIARHPEEYRNQVAQTLSEMEIPSEVSAQLDDVQLAPVFAAKTALILVAKDWPRQEMIRLAQLLLSPETAAVLDLSSMRENLLFGRERWQELIQKNFDDERELLLAFCQELVALEQPQPLADYCQRLWRLVASRYKSASPGAPAAERLLALGRLNAILQELAGLAPYYPQQLTLLQFEQLFLKALGGKTNELSARIPQRGTGVRLLDPVGARGLFWRGAAVLGLEEGEYPSPWPEDWLFPEKMRHSFRKQGIRLHSRAAMAGRERNFFNLAVTRATERLLLTYKAQADGALKLPSPYLVELLARSRTPCKKLVVSQQFPDASSLIASQKELAFCAQATANSSLWLKYQSGHPQLAKSIARARRMLALRDGNFWSVFDGLLADRQVQAALPFTGGYLWSAGQLETYGSCPFRFYCQEVLKIEPLFQAEVQLTPKDLGTALHAVLAQFFRKRQGQFLMPEGRASYRQELADLLEANWQDRQADLFAELQKTEAREMLWNFLESELTRQEAAGYSMSPRYLEAPFGMEGPSSGPLELDLPGRKVRLRGRIDRIDASADGKFMVFDYKLGYLPTYEELTSGLSFQLPIYLWAGEKLKLGTEPIAALFYSLGRGNFRGFWRREEAATIGLRNRKQASLSEEEWEQNLERSKELVATFLERIASGDFRVCPQKCPPYCDYKTICYYQKWRVGRKEKAKDA